MRDYLVANPDVLVESYATLQQQEEAAKADRDAQVLVDNRDTIFNDPNSWVGGNPDGDITVVEFIDYRCGYCRKAWQEVDQLINTDGNIRFVLKEFPILGDQSVLASRFASQWLRLQDLDKLNPDVRFYPDFDEQLKSAMRRETELFFANLVRDDRSVLDLFTSNYTFVNERLARHYRIPGVLGSQFRKVTYPDDRRGGLLGQGSILTLTSHADRTSPVLRGKWVMEVLLGTPPPAPPPNVPDLDATPDAEDGRLRTVRQRMEQHRANPACNSCHRMIDPIGLALDNFDVTGAWRIRDNGMPVDAASTYYDGTPLTGPADLRRALLSRTDVLVQTFAENLMTYALGRRLSASDMPAVRALVRQAGAADHRPSSFIVGIVRTPAFRMKGAEEATTAGPGQ